MLLQIFIINDYKIFTLKGWLLGKLEAYSHDGAHVNIYNLKSDFPYITDHRIIKPFHWNHFINTDKLPLVLDIVM